MQKKAISYVRYSSGVQALGDSLRRQTEDTEKWCAENDAELLDTYSDLGISAFRGKNVEEGALGSLLAIAKGEVKGVTLPEDVFLVCESLDRLGRDEIEKQLAVFLSLLAAGVNIVTLLDGQTYYRSGHPLKKQGDAVRDLIISITIMSRAYEESLTKGKRSAKNWLKKHREAREEGKPVSKNCPSWIRIVDEKFELIPERVQIIRRMIKMFSKEELGVSAISTKLNKDGVPRFCSNVYHKKEGGFWRKNAVTSIIGSPALFGRYIPNSKKEIQGKPVDGYYPPIITEGEFKKMVLIQKARSKGGNFSQRGKTTKKMNLLSGIGLCGVCGERLYHECKSVDYRYYACSHCKKTRQAYRGVNDCLLDCIPQIDWDAVYGKDNDVELDRERSSVEAKLVDLKLQFADAEEFLKKRSSPSIMEKVADLEDEIASAEKELDKFLVRCSVTELESEFDLNDLEQRVAFNRQLQMVFKSVKLKKYDQNNFALVYEFRRGGGYMSYAKRKHVRANYDFLHSFGSSVPEGELDWATLRSKQELSLSIQKLGVIGGDEDELQKLLKQYNRSYAGGSLEELLKQDLNLPR